MLNALLWRAAQARQSVSHFLPVLPAFHYWQALCNLTAMHATNIFVGLVHQCACLACRSCGGVQLHSSAVLADKLRLQSTMLANIGASGALSVRSRVLLVRAVTDRSSLVRTLGGPSRHPGSRAPAC